MADLSPDTRACIHYLDFGSPTNFLLLDLYNISRINVYTWTILFTAWPGAEEDGYGWQLERELKELPSGGPPYSNLAKLRLKHVIVKSVETQGSSNVASWQLDVNIERVKKSMGLT